MIKKELLYLVFGLIFILGLLIILFKGLYNTLEFFENTDKLKFSNTEQWKPFPKEILSHMTPELRKIVESIPYIPYPSDPQQVKIELQNIKQKQKKLTPQHKQQIYSESEDDLSFLAQEMTYNPNYVNTMLFNINTYIDPIIMYIKNQFDRVRPYQLDKEIKPTIDYPGHPSYPSGHAVQIYYMAYYMAQKEPQNKSKYLKIAKRVSTNREYAGVHYESDSKYGQIIGEYLASIYYE